MAPPVAQKFVITGVEKIGKERLLQAASQLIEVATKEEALSRLSKAWLEKQSKSK